MSARYARDLKKDLEGFEKTLEDLKQQGVVHHEAAMAQGVQHHEESLEQIGGLHAKLDEMAGAGTSFLSALDTGELPPRPADQSDEQRLRLLRSLKRAADNEIPQLQESENLRKTARLAEVRHGAEAAAVNELEEGLAPDK